MRGVVITGLGVVAPNGLGKEAYWYALANGKSGIRQISKFDPSPFPCRIAGEIPTEWFRENELALEGEQFSWSTIYALKAARLALQDAALDPETMTGCSSGVFMGISSTDMGVVQKEYDVFQDSNTTSAGAIAASFPHAPASQLAKEINCNGNVITVSTGCSSGLYSLILAAESIICGESEVVLAGGVDAPLTPLLLAGFCATGLLPTGFNDAPETASRPFDAKRQGGVLSEGAGVLVLEEEASARRRGAPIYAKICGWGATNTFSPASLRAAANDCLIQALHSAGLQPEQIDYINAHSPGDPVVDRAETRAIKEVWGKYAYNIPVSSIKSMIGSPLAASGPLQTIATALALQNQFIPPTVNYQYLDPRCDLDYVPNRGRAARVVRALINLQGFGGGNTTLVISKPS
ncbi:MAG: beta-ketoacyl-[acyl-carrier-protein] synthase family protein [Bacillota bacterium]